MGHAPGMPPRYPQQQFPQPGYPGYNQPFPGQQPWPQPSPKRGGSGWWLALPLVVVALMIGYFALTQGASPGPEEPTNHDPTPTHTGPNGDPSDDDTDPPTDVAYKNEDYRVPAIGQGPAEVYDPHDRPALLNANPFYSQKVAEPVFCEARAVEDVTDARSLQDRMEDLGECLTRVHGPALEAAGFKAHRPQVLVYSSDGESPCGKLDEAGAFYCPANQRIYMSDQISLIAGKDITAIDYVMAHEYSHNVQGRNGSLLQRYYEQKKLGSKEEQAEVTRRIETQADCYAAAFMHSVSHAMRYDDRDRELVIRTAGSVGDNPNPKNGEPGTHGVAKSRMLWTKRGWEASTYNECNTFSAPSSEVR